MPTPQGWTVGPAPAETAWTPGPAPAPDFTSTNAKDASGAAEVDPNTLGTALRHFGSQINPVAAVQGMGQILPIPKALGGAGVIGGPLQFVQHAIFPTAILQKSVDAFKQGDYVTAARHFIDYVIPVIGPALEQPADELQQGKYAAGMGDAIGLGTALFGADGLANMLKGAKTPALTKANPALDFAKARGIPVDAATATDNLAVRGTQAIVDRSLGGSLVATPARAAQAAAMERVGGELAADAHPAPMMPEQAGQSLRDALTAKVESHRTAANTAYERLRAMEANPFYGDYVPVDVSPAVKARMKTSLGEVPTPDEIQGLRRIREELNAVPFKPGRLSTEVDGHGDTLKDTYSPRAAGAPVYHDILQFAPGTADLTRADVQASIEKALATGRFTNAARGALKVVRERAGEKYSVTKPILEPLAGQETQGMLMPVDLRDAKVQLKPIYDQLMREKDIAPLMGARGRALVALDRVMRAPDHAPVSVVDAALGDLKALHRASDGAGQHLAKQAIASIDGAVQLAVAKAGPEARAALRDGRAATVAKYQTLDVLDSLHAEPVKALNSLTAPKDAAIQRLRTVTTHVPQQAPIIARAYLEDLLAKPNKVAEWHKLGAQTKAILFPRTGQAAALDHFFALTRRISDTNVNPSGSGYVASLGAQGAMLWYDPVHAIPMQISAAALAKLLRTPTAVQALTRGLTLPKSTPLAMRAAATAKLVQAADAAGVPLALPQAADREPGQSTPPR